MLRLLVSNTHTKVDTSGCSKKEAKEVHKLLKEKFTVHNSALQRDPRVLRGLMSANVCFYNENVGLLPTGLVPHLRLYLKSQVATGPWEVVDYRSFPVVNPELLQQLERGVLKLGKAVARDYQVEALRALVKYRCGVVEAATGAGKTLLIAGVAALYSSVPVLVLFNRTSLLFQTYSALVENYGFSKSEVGTVGGNTYNDECRVTLMTVQSYVNVMHLFPRVRVVVTDEAHETGRSATAEKVIYSCQAAPVRVGFSATVSTIDNPYERTKLYGNVGPVVYKVPYDVLRDNNVLADVTVSMYRIGYPGAVKVTGVWQDSYETHTVVESDVEKYTSRGYEVTKTPRGYVAKKLSQLGDESVLYTYNKERNELIAKLCSEKERVLVLYGKLAHGEELRKLLPHALLISGKDSENTRKVAKEYLRNERNSVVLASSIFDVGVDVPSVKTLVLAGSSVSTVRVLQKVGRSTRKDVQTLKSDAEVVDFMQYDNALSLKQSKKRKAIYEELLKVQVKVL